MSKQNEKSVIRIAITNSIIDISALVMGLLLFITSLFNERFPKWIIFSEWMLMCIILAVTSVLLMSVYVILSSMIDDSPDESRAELCTDIFEMLYMPKIMKTGFVSKVKFNIDYIFTHLPKPLYFVVVVYQSIPYLKDFPLFIPISLIVEIILMSMFIIERMMIRKAIIYLPREPKNPTDNIIVSVISEDSKSKLPAEFETKQYDSDNSEENPNDLQ